MPGSGRQTPSRVDSAGDRALRGTAPPTALLVRSAGTVGALTLISRVFGFLRDAIVSALLGTSDVADAFQAAYQVPNMLRRLAGEGTLTVAFVPVFSGVERRRSADVWLFAGRFQTAVAVVVAAATLIGILTADWLVPLIYDGFAATPGKLELTVTLTRLLFVYAFFISMSAVLMAVLNASDRFAAAAFTPVLLNVVMISAGAAAWLSGAQRPVMWLAAGVIGGGLAQWLFLVPFARRLGMPLRPRFGLRDPDLRSVGRLVVPRILGVGVVQLNVLVGQVLAAGLGAGAVTSLYYGARIQELTLGVFAVSVATVVLPTLSRQGAAGELAAMRETLSFALRQVTAVTVPAAVGILLLRHQIIAVLFERGRFDSESTALTATALAGFAVGLASVAAVRVLVPGFYALHDTRTPVLVALAGVVINLACSLALRGPLGNGGIALANSLAATAGAGLLFVFLRRRLGRIDGRGLLSSLARVSAASVAMAMAVIWVPTPFSRVEPGLAGAPDLFLRILASLGVYAGAMLLLRAPEVTELRSLLRGRAPDILADGATSERAGGAGADS